MKSRGQAAPKYRLIYVKVQLKNLYARRYIQPALNATLELMGLQEACMSWQGLSKIANREATRSTSIVGGQGMIKFDFIITCTTKQCKCKKVNRYCTSRCHKENQTC